MRRALVLALALALASPALAEPKAPPPWMPAPPPPVGGARERAERARKLKQQSAILTGVGIGLFGAGIALNVIALDWKQGTEPERQPDGSIVNRPAYDAGNYAELAGGVALMATGFVLVVVGVLRGRQAAALAW